MVNFTSTKKKPPITFMGRPRGRKYQNISISLELEQIEYLETQSNPSALIRRLLSQHMKSEAAPQAEDSIASLKSKLERAEKEYAELKDEFTVWEHDHEKELYEDLERKEWAGLPWFKEKRTARTDKLIKTYHDYEKRLKQLTELISTLKEAIAKSESPV